MSMLKPSIGTNIYRMKEPKRKKITTLTHTNMNNRKRNSIYVTTTTTKPQSTEEKYNGEEKKQQNKNKKKLRWIEIERHEYVRKEVVSTIISLLCRSRQHMNERQKYVKPTYNAKLRRLTDKKTKEKKWTSTTEKKKTTECRW